MARLVRPPGISPDGERTAPRSPWRVFAVGAVVIIAVVAGLLLAIRTFLFPVWEANSEATRSVATAQAQLDVLRTQEALTPRPTPTDAPVAAVQPTLAPTRAPTAIPTVQPTPLATSAPAAVTSAPAAVTSAPAAVTSAPAAVSAAGVTPTPWPTVPPELNAEISAAYLNYFQVRGDALLALDSAPLSQVAANGELTALQKNIENDRAQGRALETNVQHEFVVLSVQGNEAVVADRYRDSSIFVDPVTHEPLPGQVVPASADVAPVVKVVYHLQRIDGIWKVLGGERAP